MNIICAASGEVLDIEKCYRCALNNIPTPCGYTYGLIKEIYKQADRSGIHVTDLTGCLRKAFYDKSTEIPKSPADKLILTIGTMAHALLEEDDEFLKSEIEVEAFGVVGRADAIHGTTLIDYKTTRWLKPSRLPYGAHGLQVNIYARLLKEMGVEIDKLVIQYIDMSGPTKCRACRKAAVMNNGVVECPSCEKVFPDGHIGAVSFEVPMMDDDEIEEFIVTRSRELRDALDHVDDPDVVVPDAEPSFLCGYCDHTDICPEAQ